MSRHGFGGCARSRRHGTTAGGCVDRACARNLRMKILIFLGAFLFAIGILVAVHEFGHYWVAKKLGFKVLRFSIGFGKPLLTRVGKDADRTEYCLAAIPLGGYVKLLDEREGEVSPEELPRSFTRRPIA